MALFGFMRSDSEIKRDHYYKLYNRLESALAENDRKVSRAHDTYYRYMTSLPEVSAYSIPSRDFERKRDELNEKLHKYFNLDQRKRKKLVIAIDRAYERYRTIDHPMLFTFVRWVTSDNDKIKARG